VKLAAVILLGTSLGVGFTASSDSLLAVAPAFVVEPL